jgi:hypothetical protein
MGRISRFPLYGDSGAQDAHRGPRCCRDTPCSEQCYQWREGVRCSRKKKTSPRGDVPNRHKTSHDPEYSSSSGEEASDEDADEAPTRAPLGRRVSGLKEQTTRRPEFKTLVSYCTYRLADTTRVVDSVDTGRVNGYLKKLKHHLDYEISGDPAI